MLSLVFGVCRCPTVAQFDMQVDANMTSVMGRELEAPRLRLRNRENRDELVDPDRRDPRWDLRNIRVFQGTSIEH